MDRQIDHAEKSKLALELSNNEAAIKAAQNEIFSDLISSVMLIKDIVKSTDVETSTRLKAAQEHLKLAGMYVEKVQHSGEIKGLVVGLPEADGGTQEGPQ